jgi:Domain of unknown function (DUF4926)
MDMLKDLDIVALTRDLAEYHLKQGDTGTVVHVYDDEKSYEVEFMTFGGDTIAVVTLPADAIRPIAQREIMNARQVA